MADVEDYKARTKRGRATALVLLDPSTLREQHETLEAKLAEAVQYDLMHNQPDTAGPIAEQVQALEAEIVAAESPFVFEALGTTAWLALEADHPPDDDERRRGFGTHRLTFMPAAVAASCVDPPLTLADAEWFMGELQTREWDRLCSACARANLGSDDRPKSRLASVALQQNGSSPTSPDTEVSPEAGSLADDDAPSPPTTTTT